MEIIQLSLFGKTFPEHSVPTRERTSGRCCRKSHGRRNRGPISLDLRAENGGMPGRSWAEGFPSHGECWTPNTGECPSAAVESTLSQILEADVPEKYYLSPKACLGILRRASACGKELPEPLRKALERQAADVGETRCNELAVKVYGICSKQSHAMQSDNPHSGFYEADTSRCLDTNGGNPSCNQGGMAVVAVQGSMIGRSDKNGPQGSGVNEDVSFTLDATDRHAVAYGIDRATYNMGRNAKFGLGIEEELEPTIGSYTQALEEQSPTLMARDDKDTPVVNETEPEYNVRRLTPTECARLQGFPDWWCDGVEGSDSAQYRMWGNGIALPCALYVMEGIAENA